jgi:hypothetical protein
MTSETIHRMQRRGGGVPRDDWRDEEVRRLREYLKRGVGLVDIALALERTPEDVAAKLSEFHPARIRDEAPAASTRGPDA